MGSWNKGFSGAQITLRWDHGVWRFLSGQPRGYPGRVLLMARAMVQWVGECVVLAPMSWRVVGQLWDIMVSLYVSSLE